MKKAAALMLAGIMALGAVPVMGEEEMAVYLDGVKLSFDQPPVIKDDRTLVPLRGIFEALGAGVEWDAKEKRVSASWERDGLEMFIGEDEIKLKSGTVIKLDVPAQIINSRTMVPLRAVSEAMGAEVSWIPETGDIFIEKDFSYRDMDRFFAAFDAVDEAYVEKNEEDECEFSIAQGTDSANIQFMAYHQSYELDLNIIFEEYVWNVENYGENPEDVIAKGTYGDGFYVIYIGPEDTIYTYIVSRKGDIVCEFTSFYFDGYEFDYKILCEQFFKELAGYNKAKG